MRFCRHKKVVSVPFELTWKNLGKYDKTVSVDLYVLYTKATQDFPACQIYSS